MESIGQSIGFDGAPSKWVTAARQPNKTTAPPEGRAADSEQEDERDECGQASTNLDAGGACFFSKRRKREKQKEKERERERSSAERTIDKLASVQRLFRRRAAVTNKDEKKPRRKTQRNQTR